MSKKISEFDRYDRMKKMEKEAEAEKRKEEGIAKKKQGRHKAVLEINSKSGHRDIYEEDYY